MIDSPAPNETQENQVFKGVQLFCLGFLTLFLELALIRFLAGNIWNMGYFPNLVLLTVFIGMGLGFTFHQLVDTEKKSQILFHTAIGLLLLLVAYVVFYHPTVPGFKGWASSIEGELFFTATPPSAVEQSTIPFVVCFIGMVAIFTFISQRTAKIFRHFKPLTAYTLDIGGSCAGIISFMLISALAIPATYWFLIFGVLCLVPMTDTWKTRWLPLLACSIIASLVSHQDTKLLAAPGYEGPIEVHWSPYQKVEYIDASNNPRRIFVNGISHQHMEHPDKLERSILYWPIHAERANDKTKKPYKNVLILGAGSGSDVSAALKAGAEHVDAVEIDPIIASLGKKHNLAKVYDDARVNLVIDDGRAFMTRTPRKYDLVVFALTDSLVRVSSMSQLRLENYLFTQESVAKAYQLLNPGGDIVFANFYRETWLLDKIKTMLQTVSGKPPRTVAQQNDFYVLATRKTDVAQGIPQAIKTSESVHIPSDDWPFLYMKERSIPSVYLMSMAGMSLLVLFLMLLLHLNTRRSQDHSGPGMLALKLAFVFMGVAFLLLETKSIIQFSLLFGTTWINNSLVFLAVLLLVLAANWAAVFIPRKWLWVILSLLLLSTLIPLLIPLSSLLNIENSFQRFILASLITFSPIFFANLVFSISFREQKIAEHIFGWNLIGATLGGVAEYMSILTGYESLVWVVAACYALVGLLLLVSRNQINAANNCATL